MTTSCIPPIERLVPHRAPMLLIDRVIATADSEVTAEARTESASVFAMSGKGVPSYVGIEMMAQTVCAYDALQRLDEGPTPLVGFLLGCRKYSVQRHYLAPGAVFVITARKLLQHGDMASFSCRIREADGMDFAEASLNVYRPSDAEAFLRRKAP